MMNCELAAGNRVNVYPNSAYKCDMCSIVFKNKGDLREANRAPILYEEAVTQLLVALKLPGALAVIRCLDHQKTDTLTPK